MSNVVTVNEERDGDEKPGINFAESDPKQTNTPVMLKDSLLSAPYSSSADGERKEETMKLRNYIQGKDTEDSKRNTSRKTTLLIILKKSLYC